MADINQHVRQGFLEARQDEGEVVHDHTNPLSIEAEEVMEVAQEAAGRLDEVDQLRDIREAVVLGQLPADQQELECDAVTSPGLLPTPSLLHA